MGFLSKWRARKGADEPGAVDVSERDGVRYLHLGGVTVQSAMRVNAPNGLELAYTRAMMGFLLFHPEPRNILMIGLGGGSVAKFVHHKLPAVQTRVVEISPQVVTAARNHFFVPEADPRLQIDNFQVSLLHPHFHHQMKYNIHPVYQFYLPSIT